MIYIETNGGLCNRMRAIASAHTLAKKFGTGITILWGLDNGMNCSIYELFEEFPDVDNYKIFRVKKNLKKKLMQLYLKTLRI